MITNSSFDAPSRPLIKGLRSKTVDELVSGESKTMVFKALNELAPQCSCDLFTRTSSCSSYSLCDMKTDLRLPMKRSANSQRCSSYRGAKLWNSLSSESLLSLLCLKLSQHLMLLLVESTDYRAISHGLRYP